MLNSQCFEYMTSLKSTTQPSWVWFDCHFIGEEMGDREVFNKLPKVLTLMIMKLGFTPSGGLV